MPTILIVDDSPVDRVLVEGLLRADKSLRAVTASDGADALSRVGELEPDLVITDLQMPEMDGLQLVTAMKIHYPEVPVLLITAHGSEELAIRALEQGAASYVPKSQLGDKLLESAQRVLALSRSDRSYQRLTACMDAADFRFTLGHETELFQRLVELVQQIAVSMGLCDVAGQVRLGMALEEALSYMQLRGNMELSDEQLQEVHMHTDAGLQIVEQRRATAPFRDRKLRVACQIKPHEARLTITHAGPALPVPLRGAAGSSPELEAASDRSLVLMRAFLDDVQFSRTGNEVLLIKRRSE
jgi:CheY-like chemotaxis protein